MTTKVEEEKLCNCRKKEECPLDGKCLIKNVVYRAEVKSLNRIETYVGLSSTTFKERWRNHKADFKKSNTKPCQLVKYVKNLTDKNVDFDINWSIVTKAQPFSQISNVCNLCINEKYEILYNPQMASLNTRNELTSGCRHKTKKLLDKG